ncbi:hypothetical protein T484DRAFT_1891943, partial [Baffinella frigidus]
MLIQGSCDLQHSAIGGIEGPSDTEKTLLVGDISLHVHNMSGYESGSSSSSDYALSDNGEIEHSWAPATFLERTGLDNLEAAHTENIRHVAPEYDVASRELGWYFPERRDKREQRPPRNSQDNHPMVFHVLLIVVVMSPYLLLLPMIAPGWFPGLIRQATVQ